ncbi:MAG: polysaccharide deacetylase family protein [Chloroflexi bacterium]|nr:polysaccharide deacetylase family protein [Chloroflexota bacterium]
MKKLSDWFVKMTMRILQRLLTLVLYVIVLAAGPRPYANAQSIIQTEQPDGTLRRLHAPILMYHYVSELPPDADNLRRGLTVTPQQLRQHLEFMRSRHYAGVSLYEIYLALSQGHQLPPNPVAITFDDGYFDHLTNVLPALRDTGFIGTFFIITEYADNLRPGYLTWDQVNQIAAAGMEIASHSKTHVDLQTANHDSLVYEILGSIESIQANIGSTANIFAYPMGRYDDRTLDMLRQNRIKAAVTTAHAATHTTDGLLELARLRVQNTTGVPGLEVLLKEK